MARRRALVGGGGERGAEEFALSRKRAVTGCDRCPTGVVRWGGNKRRGRAAAATPRTTTTGTAAAAWG